MAVYIRAYLKARIREGWEPHICARYASNAVRAYRRQRIERFGRI